MNRVQQVVDWIIEEDMYCLLNTHHDGGTEGWVEASYRAFENINLSIQNCTQILQSVLKTIQKNSFFVEQMK